VITGGRNGSSCIYGKNKETIIPQLFCPVNGTATAGVTHNNFSLLLYVIKFGETFMDM
jgi:hypothetical protein